jgi:DNA-binding protein HU-beta
MKNKADLIEEVAKSAGLSKSTANVAFNAIFASITKSLAKGEVVNVSSFGKFEVKQRAARMGVSPRDISKKIKINSVKVARFRAGKGLKQAVR